MTNKVLSLQYLRGFAAIFVVFFHFRYVLNGAYGVKDLGEMLFSGGAFGVDLFFMVSGFIISLSTSKITNTKDFLLRRFFRIYPAFWFVLFLGAITVFNEHSLCDFLRAAIPINKNYAMPSPFFGFNLLGPAWTISYEIYFYIIFCLSMSISHSKRIYVCSVLIAAPIIITHLLYSGHIDFNATGSPDIPNSNNLYSFVRFISSPIMIDFIIGMIIYDMHKKKSYINKKIAIPAFIFLISVFISLYISSFNYGFGITGFGLWSLFLFAGCLILDKGCSIRQCNILIWLGELSYSLYISHYLILTGLMKYRPSFWLGPPGITKLFIGLLMCFLIAIAIHYFVEKPFISLGKKLSNHKKNS